MHAKFQRYTAKKTFQNSGLDAGEIRKMCVFQLKTGHISETVRDTSKVSLLLIIVIPQRKIPACD